MDGFFLLRRKSASLRIYKCSCIDVLWRLAECLEPMGRTGPGQQVFVRCGVRYAWRGWLLQEWNRLLSDGDNRWKGLLKGEIICWPWEETTTAHVRRRWRAEIGRHATEETTLNPCSGFVMWKEMEQLLLFSTNDSGEGCVGKSSKSNTSTADSKRSHFRRRLGWESSPCDHCVRR